MPETKVVLSETDLPTQWYNLQADLPFPLPPVIHPATKRPIGPDDLAPLFPMELIKQEVCQDPWVAIPEPVRDIYRLWRPTPTSASAQALRARRIYKWEGEPGKINRGGPAYYGRRRGALNRCGPVGSALALACQRFGLSARSMVVSYERSPRSS
jgi:tryptophan synthase beta chain